jgi:mannosyltransferase OCH1-like enzyme
MIPRVFHQIWINEASPALPERYHAWQASWVRHHPDWAFRLWNLDNLDFTPEKRALIDAAPSYAQKADILRYELLWRHGGVYLDVDFECLRPVDTLLQGADHFVVSENGRVVSIGIVGAMAGSPLLRRCIDWLPAQVGRAPPNLETGPTHFTRCLLAGGCGPGLVMPPGAWFYPYAMDEPERSGGPFPDAYAVHHWDASWTTARRPWWRRGLSRLRQSVAA